MTQPDNLVDLTARRRAQLRTVGAEKSDRRRVLAIGDFNPDRVGAQAEAMEMILTDVVAEVPPVRPRGVDTVLARPKVLGARGEPRAPWLDEVDRIYLAQGDENPFVPVIPRRHAAAKRLIDIITGSIALAVASPVIAVAAIWIRLDSKGPAIFRQTRVGRDGHKFSLLKLRTMQHNNDDTEHRNYVRDLMKGRAQATDGVYRLADDPRVTRAGAVLRHYSIDELPQLWNVVKGDMSMIGPRPNSLHETALYDARSWERLRVKPGMTGLWQVEARGLVSFEEMVELDIKYWATWSFWGDIKLLLRTPIAVLKAKGAQ